MIGIAITTFNRPEFFRHSLEQILALAPSDAPIIVVDDGSTVPAEVPDRERITLYRFAENQGIAIAKNKCLEMLCETEAEHFFLFDDDTRPVALDWWRPYVESDQPHLMYQFPRAPSHWAIQKVAEDDRHRAYDKPRGCMLYVERHVLDVVGGMHTVFGKHGGEHGDWSIRIHRAGFTRWPFADVKAPGILCADEHMSGISSVDYRDHQQWRKVDPANLRTRASYRRSIPVLVPRRPDHGHRDRLWALVRDMYWGCLRHACPAGLDVQVFEGLHTDGAFNRSAAINAAARDAGDWEIAIVADSDSWVPEEQLRQAVALARRSGRMVAAFDSVHELSARITSELLDSLHLLDAEGLVADRVRTGDQDPTIVQSTMLVVPRKVWDAVGGFDEGFAGWGCEDNAFWRAVSLVTGKPLRIRGPAWHLWHPPAKPASRTDPHYQRNLWRWSLYANALCADDVLRLRR